MSKITLVIAFIISHFFAGLEAVGTYLLWAGLVAISVLAYVYAPHFMETPEDEVSTASPPKT